MYDVNNPIDPPVGRLQTRRPKLGCPARSNLSPPRRDQGQFLRRPSDEQILGGMGRNRRSPVSDPRQKLSKRYREPSDQFASNGYRFGGGMWSAVGVRAQGVAQLR